MKISFYIKEEDNLEEDYLAISIVRKSKERHQSTNVKKLDDLTAVEQQMIKNIIITAEKYNTESEGAIDIKYNL
jgi:hypothetical protein